jgi:predicted NAD/FAD-binding protein
VLVAGIFEEGKASIVDLEILAAQFAGELGTAAAMTKVEGLIDAARVMKDGEELDHVEVGARRERAKAAAVLEHARPMGNSVDARAGQSIVFEDTREEGRGEEGHEM